MEPKNCCLSNVSEKISGGLEDFFYKLGIFVSERPLKVIFSVLFLVFMCSLGMLKFHEEKNMVKLWIPTNTDFSKNYQWLMENFPPDIRFNSIIFEDNENVLRPEVIRQMYQIHKIVSSMETSNGTTWNDVCMKLPIVSVDIDASVKKERSKRSLKNESDDSWGDIFKDFESFSNDHKEEDFEAQVSDEAFAKIVKESGEGLNKFDPSVVFYPDQYCPVVENMKNACYETSILEMFAIKGAYNSETDDLIENLTQQQIIDLINTATESGVFMVKQNFHQFLGGIERNSSGHIVGAKSTLIRWIIKAKITKGGVEDTKRDNMGLDEQVDETTLAFEEKMQEVLKDQSGYPKGLQSFANVQRSFGDLSTKAIWDDVKFLIVGYMLVFIYVQIMLGRFNRVEHRATLGLFALLSVALGVATSYGLCSLMGLSYGPMHSLIPCLLVGLGVDNAFVLVQALENVNQSEAELGLKVKKRSLEDRFGDAMRHAGVGVTITSTTDVIVFLVGGTTALPSLRSYSLFTGIGIAATYFIQITFFISCLYLDQQRIEEDRDGVLCCITYKNRQNKGGAKTNLLQTVFKHLGRILQITWIKVITLAVTLTLLCVGIYGTLQLEVRFDYINFLPQDSGLYQWFQAKAKHYPDAGEMGILVFSEFDTKSELPRLKELTDKFKTQNEFISHFESWYPEFEDYVNDNFLPETIRLPEGSKNLTDLFFSQKLTQYLFSPIGAKYKNWFTFDDNNTITCGQAAPKIKMSSMKFVHPAFSGSVRHIEAMNWVKDTIKAVNFPGVSFAMADTYARWEIDEVIAHELYRNLLLALVCVSLTTLILLANIKASLFVILCVLITLIDVGGFMHFWGLAIDIVAATNIIISVGLCVDFAAHLTHSFMKQGGPLNDRLIGTMSSIGPAIFHGGISTLLAVIILADSISHVFQSYFKIFFLMIVLGLFHGLVFLPVLLSLLGPEPYHSVTKNKEPKDDITKSCLIEVLLSQENNANRETNI